MILVNNLFSSRLETVDGRHVELEVDAAQQIASYSLDTRQVTLNDRTETICWRLSSEHVNILLFNQESHQF